MYNNNIMKTFDAIVEAGQLANQSNTKQSRGVADYYLNSISMKSDHLPMMTYGLQLDRLADAPPSDLIDTESHLKNQYDILGKSGYVYNTQTASSAIPPSPQSEKVLLPTPGKMLEFFNPISGRDFNKFSKKSCNNINIWRDDITIVQDVPSTRFGHIDTRALTKDKIDTCASKH